MLKTALQTALRKALRRHELGPASPYCLQFAGRGRSGASFGCMQGDLANGPPAVRETLRAALGAAALPPAEIDALMTRLAGPAAASPLDAAERRVVNAALDTPEGRRLVDALDATLMADLVLQLDRCLAAAAAGGRRITPAAQIMIALWINMSGPPTTLLHWLGGREVKLARAVAAPDPVIDAAAVERYLAATAYFTANTRNLSHLLRCARVEVPEPVA